MKSDKSKFEIYLQKQDNLLVDSLFLQFVSMGIFLFIGCLYTTIAFWIAIPVAIGIYTYYYFKDKKLEKWFKES